MPQSAIDKTRQRMLGNTFAKGKKPSVQTLKKRSKALSKRIRINNGIKMRYVKKTELEQYLKSGWKLGMLPLSDERKLQLSIANKGNIPVNKGKKLSAKTRKKMSLAKKRKAAK